MVGLLLVLDMNMDYSKLVIHTLIILFSLDWATQSSHTISYAL